MSRIFVAILVLVFLVLTISIAADMQAERKQFITKLIQQGIFTKVNVPGTLPRVHVGPGFRGLTFDDKQLFVSVVYAYFYNCKTPACKENPDGMVTVYDGMTGKKIGTFSLSPKYGAPGLRLD